MSQHHLIIVDVIGESQVGKSAFIDHFAKLGFPVLDIASKSLEAEPEALRENFIRTVREINSEEPKTWLAFIEHPSSAVAMSFCEVHPSIAVSTVHISRPSNLRSADALKLSTLPPSMPVDFYVENKYSEIHHLRGPAVDVFNQLIEKYRPVYDRWLSYQTKPTLLEPPTSDASKTAKVAAANPDAAGPEVAKQVLKCVLFDLDNTLVTFDPIFAAVDRLLERIPSLMDLPEPITQKEITKLEDLLRTTMPHVAHDRTSIRHAALTEIAVRNNVNPAVAAELMEDFMTYRSKIDPHLFPETLGVLRDLKQRGLTVGIMTNGNADVSRSEALKGIVDFALNPRMVGSGKPHFAPFFAAAAAAGCKLSEMVMVGDDARDDILGPNQIGLKSIFICREGIYEALVKLKQCEAKPDAIVSSLSELPTALADLGFAFLSR